MKTVPSIPIVKFGRQQIKELPRKLSPRVWSKNVLLTFRTCRAAFDPDLVNGSYLVDAEVAEDKCKDYAKDMVRRISG